MQVFISEQRVETYQRVTLFLRLPTNDKSDETTRSRNGYFLICLDRLFIQHKHKEAGSGQCVCVTIIPYSIYTKNILDL